MELRWNPEIDPDMDIRTLFWKGRQVAGSSKTVLAGSHVGEENGLGKNSVKKNYN